MSGHAEEGTGSYQAQLQGRQRRFLCRSASARLAAASHCLELCRRYRLRSALLGRGCLRLGSCLGRRSWPGVELGGCQERSGARGPVQGGQAVAQAGKLRDVQADGLAPVRKLLQDPLPRKALIQVDKCRLEDHTILTVSPH